MNEEGDWLSRRDSEYAGYNPLAGDGSARGIFELSSAGLKTNRDTWVYNSSAPVLKANVSKMVEFFNRQVVEFHARGGAAESVEGIVDFDPTKFSWDRSDRKRLLSGQKHTLVDAEQVGLYRPFQKQAVWFDRRLNNTIYQLNRIFPNRNVNNHGIVVVSPGEAGAWACLMADVLPDVHVLATNQFFPRYRYEKNDRDPNQLGAFDDGDEWTRIDNVTDEILAEYRDQYGTEVTKDDIFDYVYGILHSPEYRTRFAADLKKMLPRIPKVKEFAAFRDSGRELGKLHMDYETVPQYPDLSIDEPSGASLLVTKMRYGGKRPNLDKTTIVYNDEITISGIPLEAHEYLLGSRSALDWILERYQVTVDKASKIKNDPNDWGLEHGNPRYILDLIGSIVTVSVDTVRIVKELPRLEILDGS